MIFIKNKIKSGYVILICLSIFNPGVGALLFILFTPFAAISKKNKSDNENTLP